MSQIVTRKGPVGEDKEKRQTDSPVKEMKKKIAANAEKEKQAAEKSSEKSVQNDKKPEKSTEKAPEKPAEKKDKTDKSVEKKDKPEKSLDKSLEKKDKSDKSLDKSLEKKDKSDKADKKESGSDKKENSVEKVADKKDKPSDKKDAPVDRAGDKERNGKPEIPDEKQKKPETKTKENGAAVNGEQNGDTVSSEDELHESDGERDEMFPELAYEDSDGEAFEPPTPEGVPSRSHTRRSQVKATRTPETPRPASEKNADRDYVPDDSKLLKLKDDTLQTDRKLRSADSPKPHDKKMEKVQEAKKPESPKKETLKAVQEEPSKRDDGDRGELEVEIEVVEIENEGERRAKPDTNYSRSRVKVSPYRRADPGLDLSLLANYTGNNTTMEMDITEPSLADSPYLSGLRSIRARRSYRPLKEMTLRHVAASRGTRSANTSVSSEQPSRPTGTVVGRKRRPEPGDAEPCEEARPDARGKRPRLLERLARPFRLASTPLPARRAAEIVGINTDLPLTAPVASADTFDPEAIKTPGDPAQPPATPSAASTPAAPGAPSAPTDRDAKRCIVM